MKILDCTLRDGGFLTNWNWNIDLAAHYISVMSRNADIVEIGYRSPVQLCYASMGSYRFCSEKFIQSIFEKAVVGKSKFAVMIDLKDYIVNNKLDTQLLCRQFLPCSESCFDYVRIAITDQHWEQAILAAKMLKNIGYKTTVNVMQCGVLKKPLKTISGIQKYVDILYIADSFGSMRGYPSSEKSMVAKHRMVFGENIINKVGFGVHCHDNAGLAFMNCISNSTTHKENAYCDASVLGIGRGGGNCDTEKLLMYRDCRVDDDIINLRKKYLEPLRKKYYWGWSVAYQYSAQKNIHPSYCAKLADVGIFDNEAIIILSKIPKCNRISYNNQIIKTFRSPELKKR